MKSRVQFWTLEVLMIVFIIFICTKISFVFEPIGKFISTLFFPVLIALFLYYMFNPLLVFLEKIKVPRILAILLLYVLIIALTAFGIGVVVPLISNQLAELAQAIPTYIEEGIEYVEKLVEKGLFEWIATQDVVSLEAIGKNVMEHLKELPDTITSSATVVFGFVADFALVVFTVPFILFYMFKDGHKFPAQAVKFLPASYREDGLHIIKETNETLAAYIQGQGLVCLFIGIFTFIGYVIIDLPYAFVFGIIAAITNIIPNLGPFIGAAPAFIVALFISPMQAVWVVVVVTIVQQFESNILSPRIMSQKLNLHPLTVIILVLGVGSVAGIIGMILAVPTYAVIKTITLNVVRLIQMNRNSRK